jgi:2-polyprenyl-3-methyl-5-hydroxy-6-metoxy-1,4-benzoquinol methylase
MDDRARVPSIDLALLTDAVARWQALVRARREQFERLRVEPADPGAYWRTRSRNYYSAVRQRTEPDPFVRAVLEACRDAESRDDPRRATGVEPPPATVLDVGGGFGAVALPTALSGRRVTVVEPHPSMVELLGEWATEEGVSDRVGVVQEPWPLAAPMADQHDVVVCSHVLYPIEDVVPFVRALVASTRCACLITLRLAGIEQAPAGLFRELHGEDRVPQPGFADLCAVLFQLGLSFQSSTYEAETTWSYADLDEAVAVLAESLLVAGRPEARARIRGWASEWLVDDGGRLSAPRRRSMAGIATLPPQPTRS